MIRKLVLTFLGLFFVLTFSLLGYLRVNVGGGELYKKVFPRHSSFTNLEVVAELENPPGNIAVRGDNLIALNFHPEAHPQTKVVLIRDKKQESLPNEWFDTAMSLRFDSKGFLWVLDHGFHGFSNPKILKIDVDNKKIIKEFSFNSKIAPLGSNLNDFQIDESRNLIFIADTSFLRNEPGVIVLQIDSGKSSRKLNQHKSVARGPYAVAINDKFLGLPWFISMRPAIDSIVLDRENQWLYYGAMSGDQLYRIRVEDLLKNKLEMVETYAQKPLSDGLTIDIEDNIYLTSVQDFSIGVIGANDKKYKTYAQSKDLQWPDGMSFGNNNDIFVTASSLHHVAFKIPGSWDKLKPFKILKFKALAAGSPGS